MKRIIKNLFENPPVPALRLRPFSALRERWAEGYGWGDLRADAMAGAVVGLVAIPLSMALAVASGVPPQHGLYTAMAAGFLTPLFGGSRFQVTGPTAAFVVVLAPVAHRFGVAGLLLAGLMAGVFLILMGVARMGRLIQYIPRPVTVGFTAGIGLVIATLQLKDFLGLETGPSPDAFLPRARMILASLSTARAPEIAVALFTLAVLLLWPRLTRRVPSPLAALGSAAAGAAAAHRLWPGFDVATIGSRFSSVWNGAVVHGIPRALPAPQWPWRFPGPGGQPFPFGFDAVHVLLPAAFAIAMLGAIESLLSAVVADGMTQTRHDPDAELVALGTGNIVGPFLGAIPATGAIARTATNIRAGARSPAAAMVHALFVLLAVLLFAPWLSFLPMASLAALLMLVAYNMSELPHFIRILRVAPRSDVIVLLLCFGLTVVFDMVIGVSVGVTLAAFLFMRRMAQTTRGKAFLETHHAHARLNLPRDVMVYEIAGPLFFGAVENAMDAVRAVGGGVRTVIFLMEGVPVMDVTGLTAFEGVLSRLSREKKEVYLVAVQPQPADLLKKAELTALPGLALCGTLEEAAARAKAASAGG